MTYRAPTPFSESIAFKLIVAFIPWALIIGAVLWWRFCSPCSWHTGDSALDMPMRCMPR